MRSRGSAWVDVGMEAGGGGGGSEPWREWGSREEGVWGSISTTCGTTALSHGISTSFSPLHSTEPLHNDLEGVSAHIPKTQICTANITRNSRHVHVVLNKHTKPQLYGRTDHARQRKRSEKAMAISIQMGVSFPPIPFILLACSSKLLLKFHTQKNS